MNQNNDLKRCVKCGVHKERSQFYPHKKTKDGLQAWCSECMRKNRRGFFNANVGVESYPVDDDNHKSIRWIRHYIHYWTCLSCGGSRDVALYRKADRSLVSAETIKKHTIEQLKDLVPQWDVRCAKCVADEKWHLGKIREKNRKHRIPNAIEEADLYLLVDAYLGTMGETIELSGDLLSTTKQVLVRQIKAESSCPYCGETEPCALDFHHLDPKTKVATIYELERNSADLRALVREIEKCTILCANCHRKYHEVEGYAQEFSPISLFVR